MAPPLSAAPRYARYVEMRAKLGRLGTGGRISAVWDDDSKGFVYTERGERLRFDVAKKRAEPAPSVVAKATPQRLGGPSRGRQRTTVVSPDGTLKAICRDRNIFLAGADGKETPLTTEGSVARRIKYGEASWVYGEELNVTDAMWFSPDSKRLVFYRFDETSVADYHLALGQNGTQTRLYSEAYPKAGTTNPKVILLVADLETKAITTLRTDFGDVTLGEYVYGVRWSPDGKEILFNRTDRKQKTMQFCAADPVSGEARTLVEERQPQSWAENQPLVKWLKDGRRFVWSSERNGFRNLYLYDISGRLLNSLTTHGFDVVGDPEVREDAGALVYRAADGILPYYQQFHCVGLDGRKHLRLTDPKFHHTAAVSPDGKFLVDTAETPTDLPVTRLLKADGKTVATLAEPQRGKLAEAGIKPAIPFSFLARDGRTTLYGLAHVPSDFDPARSYPLIVDVYGGPESDGLSPKWQMPDAETELGFVVVEIAGRGTLGRGKAFRDAVYGRLGGPEIDDHADGLVALGKTHPWADVKRVGIYGTSYGGYFTLMSLLRHPEGYRIGGASSSVTDWRQYDTIYTERYMGLPTEGENKAGYDAGSAMTYAKDLDARLLIYYGTADDNVHPANSLQLITALEKAGKRFDVLVGPDRGHTAMPEDVLWSAFVRTLDAR